MEFEWITAGVIITSLLSGIAFGFHRLISSNDVIEYKKKVKKLKDSQFKTFATSLDGIEDADKIETLFDNTSKEIERYKECEDKINEYHSLTIESIAWSIGGLVCIITSSVLEPDVSTIMIAIAAGLYFLCVNKIIEGIQNYRKACKLYIEIMAKEI